ncbi:UDP-2,3-diacylglucosamine diphosphatase [Ferriphaselus sp. R-1]|uniref:UDP-2,3-diacylglucosamine diphosphatase n=1 Tax=Ferriphaselus sp. R-1 TaxID=1485544 RepID=UPI00054D79AD|nr:UDP-2,3-diacylglucosamine diphosphatase [Ferriphaselus sp. R-1]
MTHTLLISDLHLCRSQPQITAAFERFLSEYAPRAEALYILGDLFEYWAGDDDLDDPFHRQITHSLHELSASGVCLHLLHGNRDLLMGQALASACGATLLADPVLVDLYGKPTLLSHGDALCTDDTEYQQFRKLVRSPAWQQQFLTQPLAERKAYIEQLRERSHNEKQVKSAAIMDVNVDAVAALLRAHAYPRLIHGHTHRPNRHVLHLDDHTCERWVLGDWDEHGYALRCAADGCEVLRGI